MDCFAALAMTATNVPLERKISGLPAPVSLLRTGRWEAAALKDDVTGADLREESLSPLDLQQKEPFHGQHD